jgi:N-acetylmuramoyl-L-alanine amidase
MRDIDTLVIHCADTPKGVYFDIKDIYKWHVEERGWKDVGYHYVILLDGTIQKGRKDSVSGAHVSGNNSKSIGICYIGGANGEDTRTNEQKESLIRLISSLKRQYPKSNVLGHRDFKGVLKKCPCFDAELEYKDL